MRAIITRISGKLQTFHKEGLIHVLSGNFLSGFFAYGAQLLVIKFLTVEELGTIHSFQSYVNIFAVIASLGVNTALLKVSAEKHRSIEEKTKILSTSILLQILAGIISYSLLYLLSKYSIISSNSILTKSILKYGPVLILISLSNLLFTFIQANRDFKLFSRLQVTTKILSFSSIAIGALFFSFTGYLTAFVIGYFLTICILLFKINKNIGTIRWKRIKYPYWNIAIPAWLSNLIGVLTSSLSIVFLNLFNTPSKEIGLISFPLILLIAFTMIGQSYQQVIIPNFSSVSDNPQKLNGLAKSKLKEYFKISLFILPVGLLFFPLAINYFFPKYEESIIFFILFFVGWFIKTQTVVPGALFISTGETRINFRISLITSIISLLSYYIAIRLWGIIGAPIAYVFTAICNSAFYLSIFKNYVERNKVA